LWTPLAAYILLHYFGNAGKPAVIHTGIGRGRGLQRGGRQSNIRKKNLQQGRTRKVLGYLHADTFE
jgi:hypothetical protein